MLARESTGYNGLLEKKIVGFYESSSILNTLSSAA